MKIENYGVGHRCAAVLSLLLSYCEQNPPSGAVRIVILPIPTSRDGVHISGTDRLVSEVSSTVTEGDAVALPSVAFSRSLIRIFMKNH